ncbi:sel1 repeat family protein, partial [bacterium]|nr:sel1 repeat family protein [bacterium]
MKEIFEFFNNLGDSQLNELIGHVADSIGHELSGMDDLINEMQNMVSTSASPSGLNNGNNLTDDALYKLGKKYTTRNKASFDYEIAVKLFHQAAEAGHADAQFELAFAYLTLPEDGDWINEIDTMLHIQKVLNGNIQFNLESVDEATKWLEKSAASGNEEAKEWLEWISDIEPTEEMELEDETELNEKIELDGKPERVEEIVQDDCC